MRGLGLHGILDVGLWEPCWLVHNTLAFDSEGALCSETQVGVMNRAKRGMNGGRNCKRTAFRATVRMFRTCKGYHR